MVPSLETIIQGVISTLEAVPGIGIVASQDGGQSTWARSPGAGQTYWIVAHENTVSARQGIGGAGFGRIGTRSRERRIIIHGWMPFSHELNSADDWREKLDAVEWALVTHRGLGVCARMTQLPVLEVNNIEPYTSLNPNDISKPCHHCRFAFTVKDYQHVTGS